MSSPSRKFCADAGTVPADSAARQVTPSINRYRDLFVVCGFIRVNMLLLSVKFGSMVSPLEIGSGTQHFCPPPRRMLSAPPVPVRQRRALRPADPRDKGGNSGRRSEEHT